MDLFNYLFGSITTVKESDIVIISILGAVVVSVIVLFYKEFVYVTFDDQAPKVCGISTKFFNFLLLILTALTISLSIPIVGVLLISALIVIPVISALQFRTNFVKTILIAEAYSLSSVLLGIICSFYLDVSTGGTIVLFTIAFFVLTLVLQSGRFKGK